MTATALALKPAAGHPDRRVDARCVETGKRGALLRVSIVGAAFGGRRKLLLERDADGILRRRCWRYGRGRRRQRLGGGELFGRRLLRIGRSHEKEARGHAQSQRHANPTYASSTLTGGTLAER